jgi:hypothetical protein
MINYTLFLLFYRNCGFKWHHVLTIFALQPILVDYWPCHLYRPTGFVPVSKFVFASWDENLVAGVLNWWINRKIDFKAFPDVIELHYFINTISINDTLNTLMNLWEYFNIG